MFIDVLKEVSVWEGNIGAKLSMFGYEEILEARCLGRAEVLDVWVGRYPNGRHAHGWAVDMTWAPLVVTHTDNRKTYVSCTLHFQLPNYTCKLHIVMLILCLHINQQNYTIQPTLQIDVFTFVHIQSRNLYFNCDKRAERRKIQANQYKCRRRTVVRRKYEPGGQQGKANMPVRAGSYERPLSKECDSAFTARSLEVCLDQEKS